MTNTKDMIFGEPMKSSRCTVGELFTQRGALEENQNYWNDHTTDTVMGFRIPDFQRPKVWSMQQNRALIDSLYEGIDIGTHSVTQNIDKPNFDGFVLDGQQRLNAIESYLNNEFPVQEKYWGEISLPSQRHFRNLVFSRIIIQTDDIEYMKKYYDKLNFSGVIHKESERAIPLSPSP